MHKNLADLYRPHTFEDVIEQGITATILKKQVETRQFKNAMLFAGASGCGKTTLARLFANEINQGLGNPEERDCASNNSVDDVRSIISEAGERATDGAEYKVFILDECHMFSKEAWNAFLKSIEEPYEYTIYIFCTTEPNKIPETVMNRLQRFNISKISTDGIKERLSFIAQSENIEISPDALDFIAKSADGGMRDAISKLELCASCSLSISIDTAKNVLGDLSSETMNKLTYNIGTKNEMAVLTMIDDMYKSGRDLKEFINSYVSFLLDVNKYLIFRNINVTNIPKYLEQDIRKTVMSFADSMSLAIVSLKNLLEKMIELKFNLVADTSYRTTIEVYLLMLCR